MNDVLSQSIQPEERDKAARNVTLVGALVNLVLAVAKILFGWLGRSDALVVDGVHSLSDLASDMIVLLASKKGSEDADEEHPYGHARIETLAAVGLGILLILVGLGIAWDASDRLMSPETLSIPTMVALVVAVISVLSKEILYRYTMVTAKRIRSKLLEANAWHHRSDAFSSIVVLVGVAGSMMGFTVLDAIAAVLVSLMIGKIGWELVSHGIRELIDTGLEEERVEEIVKVIEGVPGVTNLHMLRTRRMGSDALADVHIQVSPKVSVSEGHQISEEVRSTLIKQIEELNDVTVHIDPEDDEDNPPCAGLPNRGDLEAKLRGHWQQCQCVPVYEIVMHYLSGQVHLDLILDLKFAADTVEQAEARKKILDCTESLDEVGEVRLLFIQDQNKKQTQ